MDCPKCYPPLFVLPDALFEPLASPLLLAPLAQLISASTPPQIAGKARGYRVLHVLLNNCYRYNCNIEQHFYNNIIIDLF
jgi:hypothetical protein